MGEMRVIEAAAAGGPDVLREARRPVPEPGEGQVLLRVLAAGVNGPDLLQRKGAYPPPPDASDLLGLEVSGEIVARGAGVSRWAEGDRVCALTKGGGYAEYVAVHQDHCLPVPEGVDAVDAAGLPETFFTVWSNFFHGTRPRDGALFLVHGGAGGIGSTAIQIGAALGLRVFTTVGSEEKAGFAREMGAERPILYREEDFVGVVKEAGGADLVLDIIGGAYVQKNIKAANPDARIVWLAFNGGAEVQVNLMPVMLKRLVLTGSTLRPRPDAFKAAVARELEQEVWPLFAGGRLRTVTHTVLPLGEAEAAHRLMEASGHRGKVLLQP